MNIPFIRTFNKFCINKENPTAWSVFLVLTLWLVLATACVANSNLWQGIITGKYFYFAVAMGGAVLLWTLVALIHIKQPRSLHYTDLLFFVFVSYQVLNCYMLAMPGGMRWWLFLLLAVLYQILRTAIAQRGAMRLLVIGLLILVLVESVWGLLQLYGITRSYHNLFKITGSLFNPGPYSGLVSLGVPLALYFTLDKEKQQWERMLGGITLAASILVLPAAMSRAAWMAAAAGCIPILWQCFDIRTHLPVFFQQRKWRIVGSLGIIVLGLIFLVGIYYLKKDSADGRWLIWRVSSTIVADYPLTGVGFGRFAAVYGDAQAAYFLSGKGTESQQLVADSPEYAFNEYVQIAVELGFIGLFLFLLLVFYTLYCSLFQNRPNSQKHSTSGCRGLAASLLAFCVFAVFSYPFSVLPLAIVFVFLLAMLAPFSPKFHFKVPVYIRMAKILLVLILSVVVFHRIYPQHKAYKEWQSLQMVYQAGLYTDAADAYSTLYPRLYYQKQFLFEYGQSLSKSEKFEESNSIFQKYLFYGSDPMVYNCMGNNYKAMGVYAQAEIYYLRALHMVPNRHYPLYLLAKLYHETGQKEKALKTSNDLLNKSVKVPSTAIREMRDEAKKIIKSYE